MTSTDGSSTIDNTVLISGAENGVEYNCLNLLPILKQGKSEIYMHVYEKCKNRITQLSLLNELVFLDYVLKKDPSYFLLIRPMFSNNRLIDLYRICGPRELISDETVEVVPKQILTNSFSIDEKNLPFLHIPKSVKTTKIYGCYLSKESAKWYMQTWNTSITLRSIQMRFNNYVFIRIVRCLAILCVLDEYTLEELIKDLDTFGLFLTTNYVYECSETIYSLLHPAIWWYKKNQIHVPYDSTGKYVWDWAKQNHLTKELKIVEENANVKLSDKIIIRAFLSHSIYPILLILQWCKTQKQTLTTKRKNTLLKRLNSIYTGDF